MGFSLSEPGVDGLIYGYSIDRVGGSPNSVTVKKVKSGKTYFGVGFCVVAGGKVNTTTGSS